MITPSKVWTNGQIVGFVHTCAGVVPLGPRGRKQLITEFTGHHLGLFHHTRSQLPCGWLGGLGWQVTGEAPSPIEGGDGNREFLAAAQKAVV